MVLADTSVWINFFHHPDSTEKRAVDALIDADSIAMTGVVLTEILQGCRSKKDFVNVRELLLALPWIETTQPVWIKAGEISSVLLRRGVTLPIPDLIVAATAMEHSCSVFSLDKHFDKIPGLKRFHPSLP